MNKLLDNLKHLI